MASCIFLLLSIFCSTPSRCFLFLYSVPPFSFLLYFITAVFFLLHTFFILLLLSYTLFSLMLYFHSSPSSLFLITYFCRSRFCHPCYQVSRPDYFLIPFFLSVPHLSFLCLSLLPYFVSYHFVLSIYFLIYSF